MKDLEVSSFQKRPCYRYIRESDHLPTYDELPDDGTAMAKVKLFTPTGAGTWYIAAYDPKDRMAYGVANIFEAEYGSFSMQELVTYRGLFGLPIERDLHWTPKRLSEVI